MKGFKCAKTMCNNVLQCAKTKCAKTTLNVQKQKQKTTTECKRGCNDMQCQIWRESNNTSISDQIDRTPNSNAEEGHPKKSHKAMTSLPLFWYLRELREAII